MARDLINQAGFDEAEVKGAEDGGCEIDGVCGGEWRNEEMVNAVDDTIGGKLYAYQP